MSFLMQVDADMFVDLIGKAIEMDTEDKLWEKWLVELPNMDKDSFTSFNDYKDKHFKSDSSTNKTDEEILRDAEGILKMMSNPN